MTKVRRSFGDWLKERRQSLDLTQKDLADWLGYSLVAIQKIEQNRRRPSKEIAKRLAEVLDIPAQRQANFVKSARIGLDPEETPLAKSWLSLVRQVVQRFRDRLLYVGLGMILLVGLGIWLFYGYKQPPLTCSPTEYDQNIRDQPYNTDAYFERGQLYYARRQYQCAVADFDQALVLSPNHAWAYYARGSAYFKIDDFERAINDFNQALQSAELQKYDWAYWKRGLAYEWQGEIEKAIADFEQVQKLSKNPDLQKLATDELNKFSEVNAPD
jgi:tetratricopeptide (TPR) repeat protein